MAQFSITQSPPFELSCILHRSPCCYIDIPRARLQDMENSTAIDPDVDQINDIEP
jgi:hypothetical protein